MAQKCVHLSCGKIFTDPEEPCFYHSEPPIFHEGKKGWKCCKPRVFTFDEFLSITPCTKGRHSTTDLPPVIEKKSHGIAETVPTQIAPLKTSAPAIQNTTSSIPPPPESDVDDPDLTILDGSICKRRSCGERYSSGSRNNELCCFHPGAPIFHEGSKGYTCCKRRVLEFDEFLKIKGCKTKDKHLFIGSGEKNLANSAIEENIDSVRYDFYQTSNAIIASFFLKNIEKTQSRVKFGNSEIILNLITTDALPKCYKKKIPLFSSIDTNASTYKILGTKLEINLVKTNASSWPTLRSDEQPTGITIQTGKPGIF